MKREYQLSTTCWKLWHSILLSFVGGLLAAVLIVWVIGRIFTVSLPALLFVAVTLVVVYLLAYTYMRAYWRRFRFQYDEHELRVFSGVWWRKQALIPFARITNIDLIQGPWQRARKLATLKIQTAGQRESSSPEAQLWSQEDFEAMRDELLNLIKVNRLHPAAPSDGTGTEDMVTTTRDDTTREMIEILKRIETNTRAGKGGGD